MTREEAIEELKILKEDYWDDDGYGHETKQYDDTLLALDMAIKALEQEPTTNNLCDSCGNSINCMMQSGKVRKECGLYKPTTKNDLGVEHHKQNIQAYAHNFGVSEEQAEKELKITTKNDVPHCQYTDAEIAKSFIEDVEAVKEHLPCGEQMDFPNTFNEFVNEYGFKDKQEVYTNGSELIQVFRVKQWLEHIATTKNDLGVDCIDRQATLDAIIKRLGIRNESYLLQAERVLYQQIKEMPSVTPQQYQEEHNKLERIKEILSHEWTPWTPNYIQRVLDGTEERY